MKGSRRRWWIAAALLAFGPGAGASPAPPPSSTPVDGDARQAAIIDDANALIHAGRPIDAIARLDPVLADLDALHAGDKRRIYCASTQSEMLSYMLDAAIGGRDAVAIGPNWSRALFLKGFALIDLGRPREAKPYLDRALALSPHNALYLSELGNFAQAARDWPAALDLYGRAAEAATAYADAPDRIAYLTRAWRGTAFVLVEQGKLDEAEKLYRKCLALDPADRRAKAELDYVRGLRAK